MQLIMQTLESLNALEKCIFVIETLWNATAVAFYYTICTEPASHKWSGIYLAFQS